MTIKQVLYLVAIGLLIGLSVLGVKHIRDWYILKDKVEVQSNIGKATSDMTGDGAKADEDRSQTNQHVDYGRSEFQSRYQRDKRDDVETANHANHVVPKRVRDNFRERRLARERSRCVGNECGAGSEEDRPPKR